MGEHATTFENWRLTRIISLTFVMPSKYCRWATFDREVLGGTSELVWRGSKRELTRSAPLLPSVELMKYSANPRVWACKQIKKATPKTTPLRLKSKARLR